MCIRDRSMIVQTAGFQMQHRISIDDLFPLLCGIDFFQQRSNFRKQDRCIIGLRDKSVSAQHLSLIHIFNIVWKIRFKTQFLTQLTYMIMNRFSRIEITILFPNQIGNQFVSKDTFGISKDVYKRQV